MAKTPCTSASGLGYKRKRPPGRPKNIDSQDAQRARKHVGTLGFQAVAKTSGETATSEQTEEQTESPLIGHGPTHPRSKSLDPFAVYSVCSVTPFRVLSEHQMARDGCLYQSLDSDC